MSKIVKSIKKGFKKIAKVVKKIVKSKIFKVVLIAAAIYFGGAGLASMMKGGTFSAGVGSAGASLSSAGSSLMAGEFATAGSTLTSAWSTAGTVGGGLGSAGTMATGAANTSLYISQGAELATAGELALGSAEYAAANAAPMTAAEATVAAAKTTAQTAMAGQALNAYGTYKSEKDAEKQAEKRRMDGAFYGMNGRGEKVDVSGGMRDVDFGSMNQVGLLSNRPADTATGSAKPSYAPKTYAPKTYAPQQRNIAPPTPSSLDELLEQKYG